MSTEVTYRVLAGGVVELSHKQCSVCREWKPWDDYWWNGDRRNSACKPCRYGQIRTARHNRGVCELCGGPRFSTDVPGLCVSCYRLSAPYRQAVKAAKMRWLSEQFALAEQSQRERREAWRATHPLVKHERRVPLMTTRRRPRVGSRVWVTLTRYRTYKWVTPALPRRLRWSCSEQDRHRIWRRWSSYRPIVPQMLPPQLQQRLYDTALARCGPIESAEDIAGEALLSMLLGTFTTLTSALEAARTRVLSMHSNLRSLSLDVPLTPADWSESWAATVIDDAGVYIETEDAS